MAWIRTVGLEEAEGRLRGLYDAALARAGKIWNIVRLTSLRPRPTESSLRLYQDVMFAPSGLSRAEREMVATVVSAANECHY
jgi:alkylhydroperoxidase family enzyme